MIPRTTLRSHFKKPDASTKRSRKSKLNADEELKIHNWIVKCLQLRSPLCSSDVIKGANKVTSKSVGIEKKTIKNLKTINLVQLFNHKM